MRLIGILQIGQDAELFYTTKGTPIGSLRGWWKHGREDSFQWVDLKIFGERSVKVVPLLTKGKRIMVIATDVHVETYERRGNQDKGVKLVGMLEDFEFAERKEERPEVERRPLPGTAAFDDIPNDLPEF